MNLSIIVPTYDRPELCRRNLLSLEQALAKTPSYKCEVIVGVNGNDPKTSKVLNEMKTRNFHLRVYEYSEMKNPSTIRNRLLEKARGHWIYFSDDDAYVSPNFFEKFIAVHSEIPQVAVIGGPNLTPPNSNLFQRASGLTLSSRFATYFSSARYKEDGQQRICDEQSLILCNLFIRRSALEKEPFSDDLVCAEENWLLQHLKKNGEVLIYEPSLSVWHDRRPSLLTFCRQVFKYGTGRGQIFRKDPSSIKPAHILPTLCLSYSCLVFYLWLSGHSLDLFWLSPFIAYSILCLTSLVLTGQSHESSVVKILSSLLFPLVHIFYGCGVLWGLFIFNGDFQGAQIGKYKIIDDRNT